MYAIIQEGNKQFKVTSGDTILIDRERDTTEKTITFDKVMVVGGEGSPKIGAPILANVTVTADVIGPVKGPKIDIFKYKRRKGYRRHLGHRQQYLKVRITGINA